MSDDQNQELEKTEVEEYLDDSYGTKHQPKSLMPKYRKTKLSKIEKGGESVINHLLELVRNSDLSYIQMAKRINEAYDLSLTKSNVVAFFRTNSQAVDVMLNEEKSLSKIRAKRFLEYNNVLVGDIKSLDKQIVLVEEDNYMPPDKKAKLIADIIDKKGKLLIRHAKLKGDIKEAPSAQVQVNIFNKIDQEKSDVIDRLKKADFKIVTKKVIDV